MPVMRLRCGERVTADVCLLVLQVDHVVVDLKLKSLAVDQD